MPISQTNINYLFEIYQQVLELADVFVIGPEGENLQSYTIDNSAGVRIALNNMVGFINSDETRVANVNSLLNEMWIGQALRTDRSSIDSSGYSFRHGRNFKWLVRNLQAYTNIYVNFRRSGNRVTLG